MRKRGRDDDGRGEERRQSGCVLEAPHLEKEGDNDPNTESSITNDHQNLNISNPSEENGEREKKGKEAGRKEGSK